MGLFKDKDNINSKKAEVENLTALAQICKEAYATDTPKEVLRERLIGVSNAEKRHIENHDKCAGCNTDKTTEKRICRCMYYYDKDPINCADCDLEFRWVNVGDIKVTEYEVPTEKVLPGIGGMDLILDDTYAAEVKPPAGNDDTLARMISEILTYTIDSKYKPAIAVFNGSPQWDSLKKHYGKDYLTELLKQVEVFIIYVDYEGNLAKYRIVKFEKNPIS